MLLRRLIYGALFFVFVSFTLQTTPVAEAGELKIGVMDLKQVLGLSIAGKKIQEELGKKAESYRVEFTKEGEALVALQKDFEKKNSIWTDAVKEKKIREIQKRRQEFKVKQDEARYAVQAYEKEALGPILKTLQTVIEAFGKKNGYTIILDARMGIHFKQDSVDVSDAITKELDKRMK